MKIAIVHDWLVVYAGAERVLEQLIVLYPDADIYSIVDFLEDNQRGFLKNKVVQTSFIQSLPFAREKYRYYLSLMPIAVEQFDLSKYDLVISSSHAVAKGVLTGPDQLHISYVHSPMRYAWDLQHQYLKDSCLTRGMKGWIAKAILHYMRLWDVRTANTVDVFIANSQFIARRIWKTYRREATVIYPPVDIDVFTVEECKDDFYLTVSRMVPYKKVDLIVEAFSQMGKKLIVIGDGPDYQKIRSNAKSNIEFLGFQSFEVKLQYMQNASAFIFAAEEDFGIAPVEAQACGTPVIAFAKGGALETICGLDSEKPTGVFFEEQSVSAIIDAVSNFEKQRSLIQPLHCRENALKFSNDIFREKIGTFIKEKFNR